MANDRSECKPLGTTLPFEKLKSRYRNSRENLSVRSRSQSPVSIGRPASFIEIPETEKILPKAAPKNISYIRQNALTIFEFSTVYPFNYGNNKFECFICSQSFLELPLLRQHMGEDHSFASLQRLINYLKPKIFKVDVADITCKLCSQRLASLLDLKKHLKEHGKPIDPDQKDNVIPFKIDGENGPYICVECGEKFYKVRTLSIHMRVHFNNYSCDVCGTGFVTLALLGKHTYAVHVNGNNPCDRCDKVFTTAVKRTQHIRRVHMKKYKRRCHMCPETFNSNYNKTLHLQNVHKQLTRVHKCENCERAFHLKYHLNCHIKSVHLRERNHKCDQCLQSFYTKDTLKKHMVKHTATQG